MPQHKRESQQMTNSTEQPKKGLWARYKKFVLSFLVIWVVLLIALVLLTDQKNLPFVYQFG
jgi:hypothetical protein